MHFVQYLPLSSPLVGEMDVERQEMSVWTSQEIVPRLLVDVINSVNLARYEYAQSMSKSKIKPPKPYPTPWTKPDKEKIGSGAIPISEFEDWWESN